MCVACCVLRVACCVCVCCVLCVVLCRWYFQRLLLVGVVPVVVPVVVLATATPLTLFSPPAEDNDDQFGFRDIATLLREVHDIARRPVITGKEEVDKPAAVEKEKEMTAEEREEKEAKEAKEEKEEKGEEGAEGAEGVQKEGTAEDKAEDKAEEDKLYWPLSGDPESLSQLREMLMQRTPSEEVHLDTEKGTEKGTKEAQQGEQQGEQQEAQQGEQQEDTTPKAATPTPTPTTTHVFRERFTSSELKRICGVFYQGNMAADASMTFIKFTQLTPSELNYELTAQNVVVPLATFHQGFGQEKAAEEMASPLETDWEMVS